MGGTDAPEGYGVLMDEEGVVVRGLLLCVRGNEDGAHSCRIRNRDKNASRNIWDVLYAMMRGADRPEYLQTARRRRRRNEPPRRCLRVDKTIDGFE